VARLAGLLGWPQVAEAGHCTVTAGTNGVTATTGPGEKVVLPGVGVDANGHIPFQIVCSDGTGGSLTLTGGVPGSVMTVRVRVRRGGIEVVSVDGGGPPPGGPPPPSEFTCNGTIAGPLNRNVTVPAGATCVVDADVDGNFTVHGTLVVRPGRTIDGNVQLRSGTLAVQNGTIRGNVAGDAVMQFSGASIRGNVAFQGAPGRLELSGSQTTIQGNLDFQTPTIVTGSGGLLVAGNISCRGQVTDAHAGVVTASGHKDACGTL
jgi:hypothetical protein